MRHLVDENAIYQLEKDPLRFTEYLSDASKVLTYERRKMISRNRYVLGLGYVSWGGPLDGSNSFEHRWRALGVRGGEKALEDTLVWIFGEWHDQNSGYALCPQLTKAEACSGDGEAFCRLFKHFCPMGLDLLAGPPSLDFPTFHDIRFDKMFEIEKLGDASDFPRAAAVRAAIDFHLVERHGFLMSVLFFTVHDVVCCSSALNLE